MKNSFVPEKSFFSIDEIMKRWNIERDCFDDLVDNQRKVRLAFPTRLLTSGIEGQSIAVVELSKSEAYWLSLEACDRLSVEEQFGFIEKTNVHREINFKFCYPLVADFIGDSFKERNCADAPDFLYVSTEEELYFTYFQGGSYDCCTGYVTFESFDGNKLVAFHMIRNSVLTEMVYAFKSTLGVPREERDRVEKEWNSSSSPSVNIAKQEGPKFNEDKMLKVIEAAINIAVGPERTINKKADLFFAKLREHGIPEPVSDRTIREYLAAAKKLEP